MMRDVNSVGVAERPEYLSEVIGRRLGELSDALGQIEKAAVHICGSLPQPPAGPAGGGKLQAAPNGLFDEWSTRLDEMVARARGTANILSNVTGY